MVSPILFSRIQICLCILNSNWLDMRHLQEQVEKAFCSKNCSDLEHYNNFFSQWVRTILITKYQNYQICKTCCNRSKDSRTFKIHSVGIGFMIWWTKFTNSYPSCGNQFFSFIYCVSTTKASCWRRVSWSSIFRCRHEIDSIKKENVVINEPVETLKQLIIICITKFKCSTTYLARKRSLLTEHDRWQIVQVHQPS